MAMRSARRRRGRMDVDVREVRHGDGHGKGGDAEERGQVGRRLAVAQDVQCELRLLPGPE